MKINTDPKIIDEILERGVSAIYPTKEDLRKVLLSGRRLKIYIGADATGPELHLGHSSNFLLIEKFRKLGHEVIVLFGDFTAMIGDPTGKEATRVTLTSSQVNENIKTWKKQLIPIVNFKKFSNNPARLVKNSKWLSKLSLKEVIDLSANFTVQQMIERDMFDKRIKESKPVYLNEFLYPLLQGYDSVALDVDVEIGGTDQTFNMLAGRTLQKKFRNKEKFVITTTLLENPKTGKKLMSKSEGGYVSLRDESGNMFGKIMALPDEVVGQMFTDCTNLPLEEINKIKDKLEKGTNPKDIKIILAKEIITLYHGKEKAEKVANDFEKTFSKKEIPDDILEVEVKGTDLLSEILLKQNMISSKSDFARLVKENAITLLEEDKKITDIKELVKTGTYKIGKHRFVKMEIRDKR
ncbi:MAG: tyrosine--tRNA ligase [Candidatus Paceibacterota bacterium]